MGSYNILIADIKCSNCNASYEGKIQFRYGNTVQLKYRIGDKVEWGGNQIGNPNERKVKVYGILESEQCPVCANENKNNEFDIFIENGVLVSFSVMQEYNYEGEGNYMVLEN
jgi:hypothetical protein